MIAENINFLNERISNACGRSGRNKEEITLIAVSKTVGIEEVFAAKNAGLLNFGENKAQELRDKAVVGGPEIIWHFIGHLQTNKVKYVAEAARYVHSVDSLKLAEALEEAAAKKQRQLKILFEVKTSDEESKFGLTGEKELYSMADFCMKSEYLRLNGLMTMAPFTDDEAVIRKSFRQLKQLQERMLKDGYPVKELSMGMTGDFEIAIEEGATMIRIGTAIFGERIYN